VITSFLGIGVAPLDRLLKSNHTPKNLVCKVTQNHEKSRFSKGIKRIFNKVKNGFTFDTK
ncbi:MAG: hypothetical protein K2O05_03605, partial [Anaeroplasmataceae bacterium]|nr:hypothetical protein [Anaeroplasmataceae bacterium]